MTVVPFPREHQDEDEHALPPWWVVPMLLVLMPFMFLATWASVWLPPPRPKHGQADR
jgi:hypothetical protein